jgi:hypothetical protein
MPIARESKHPSPSERVERLRQPTPQANRSESLVQQHNGRQRPRKVNRVDPAARNLKVSH